MKEVQPTPIVHLQLGPTKKTGGQIPQQRKLCQMSDIF